MKRELKAFTLIELLIVVAIIAILAAIAVPNFLEAQTRSKISRAKADIRTGATALEAYYVDYNKYPPDRNYTATGGLAAPFAQGWFLNFQGVLTTPVAYLTTVNLRDPFYLTSSGSPGDNPTPGEQVTSFKYFNYGYSAPGPGGAVNWGGISGVVSSVNAVAGKNILPAAGWVLRSFGPDRIDSGAEWVIAGMNKGTTPPNADRIYDPTNGTISRGDVARFGGGVMPAGYTP